ncbi:DNA repair protein RecN [Algoriphagus namhaensis]|uniref:DNA repair protein RecN n=1 Tax=Algoriphagus namhaensis TaxID=915353 RepID=A0ABV8AMM7_9BACT
MLKSLFIKNYALIDDLELSPSAKLNMITGETGAGKSIMLGALGLLMGNRADTKVLLFSDQKCVVEGVFQIEDYGLNDFFKNSDLDYEDQCIIRREISPSGKSRSFVNDTPVLLDTLRSLGEVLMDVHSQHDTLKLGEGSYQLALVDAFAGSHSEKATYQKIFKEYIQAKKALEKLKQEAFELKKEADFNEFQLNELSALVLKSGEQESLEEELELLENSEEIKAKIQEILLLAQNEEYGVGQGMASIAQAFNQLAGLGNKFSALQERFKSLFLEFKDIEENLEDDFSSMDLDVDSLEEIRDRLSKIYQLQKKHGLDSVEALMALEQELADKVFQVQNLDESIDVAERAFQAKEKEMQAAGKLLTEKRKSGFPEFEKQLKSILTQLAIENAQVKIEHQGIKPSDSGLDSVEFLFTANKGTALQPLKKVASGGEFSRLLFAIKYIMADKMALPTLIFDEIDTGISGEVALQLVKMMKEMAANHQIICITHLPQVAGQGDAHFFVFKDDTEEKTISKIRELKADERVLELAKMIAGASPSDSAIRSAKELLSSAI